METLSALLTPAIGFAVAVVAFMQWRTSHLRAVLDLFERRLRCYRKLEEAAVTFLRSRTIENNSARRLAREGYREARFLVGYKAFARIEKFYGTLSAFDPVSAEDRLYSDNTKRDRENEERIVAVERFLLDMPNLFEPYMRMTHKRVRTPIELLHDCRSWLGC